MWARLRPLQQRRLLFTRSSPGGSTSSAAASAGRLISSLPPPPAAAGGGGSVSRRQGIALVAGGGGGGSRGGGSRGGGGGRGKERQQQQQGKVPTATRSGQLTQQQRQGGGGGGGGGGEWPPAAAAAAGSSSHGLVDAKADADRFFDILMLPSQSPMVSKKEELKLAEVDEDKLFRRHVRTAKRYNLLIRAQAERMGLAPIERTFENMLRHGIVPNVEIYTSMVVACAKNKDPHAAERYLARMTEEGLEPNIWTYTALAQAYTRAGQLQDAFQVLERLKEASIRPNVRHHHQQQHQQQHQHQQLIVLVVGGVLGGVIYTSLIHGCLLADNVDRAWDTFDHMRQREAIEPDEVTFTLMITACAQKGQVERARNVMEEMQLLQLSPTEVTYNAQIGAYYYAEAFLNLERMKAAGFRPDEVTYSALLHASSRNGDVKMAEIVFKSMNDSGMLVAKPEATRFWNSLLSAYASAQPHADSLTRTTTIATAARIIHTMKQIGQQADRYTANTLLSLYAHAHRIRSVEALFDAAFLPPRPLSAASAAPVVVASQGAATAVVDHSAGQSPPGPVSDSDDMGRRGDGGDLWAFGERFTPDVVTYTCLVQLYADTRRPDKALHAWQLMKESGVEPNMRTYEYMVRCLARSGYLNSAMKTLREMREKGFVPSHHVVTLLMQRTQS
ncbi:pentatricopeptide repeat domain/PPR repeatcontaining protein [Acanthamoeba castellanii str. Neff]|uniref:Pentatricopeptide repeat domain/PPR repeatcontaining protein n=1 Tax=Acanthamoeba castellanii (strain ATCC 30010 / Neff) TaxID=1257118 RepID=L8GSK9_ACACF|nr:pentatricopeptide repeat domain/PPR repeatcontaining protein [Acanthamoeba castellanii str. Neff]ELR16179.1 pentatricopeptide repeat domain/PPR repeatcontaining protein [Acanthamoeba castellanii str. Neff]